VEVGGCVIYSMCYLDDMMWVGTSYSSHIGRDDLGMIFCQGFGTLGARTMMDGQYCVSGYFERNHFYRVMHMDELFVFAM